MLHNPTTKKFLQINATKSANLEKAKAISQNYNSQIGITTHIHIYNPPKHSHLPNRAKHDSSAYSSAESAEWPLNTVNESRNIVPGEHELHWRYDNHHITIDKV